MSDFSLFSLFTAGLACLSVVSAYTQPKGAAPEGNPISQPGLNSVVPAGDDFTITWNPTTQGTVTLVLLKGPSSNAVPQYPNVEKTPNTGSYVWKVASDLAPSDPSTPAQGYGIQLIDDATGQYQYTTQFGISNSNYKAMTSSSSSASEAQSYQTTSAPAAHVTQMVTKYTTYCPEATTFTHGNMTYSVSKATTLTLDVTTSAQQKAPATTGSIIMPHNVTMVAPTGYIPSTILTSASASSYSSAAAPTEAATTPKPYTGAASTLAASFGGLVLAAGAAVLAL